MGIGKEGEKRRGARPSAEAQFTMILLAFSTGRRLDFVHRSGVFFLQTLLWILWATVCGTEQYFNVEVRLQCFLPLPSPDCSLEPFLHSPVLVARSTLFPLQPATETHVEFASVVGDGCQETDNPLSPAAQSTMLHAQSLIVAGWYCLAREEAKLYLEQACSFIRKLEFLLDPELGKQP